MTSTPRILARLAPGLITLLLTACKAGPDYQAPVQSYPAHFTHDLNDTQRISAIETRWWGHFDDALLTTLVEQTLSNNLDVRMASARLVEARGLLTLTGLELLPGVSTHTNYTAQKRSLDALNGRNFVPRDLELFNAGFDATWEVDLFGRLRRRVEVSEAQMEISRAERRDIIVSVIAETVRNYLLLRGAQAERSVALANLANQQEVLSITQVQLEAGKATDLDTARIRELLSVTRAGLPELDTQEAQAIHRISVLTGQLPGALQDTLSVTQDLPTLTHELNPGAPEDLIRRRPDIRSAEQKLKAATANIGVITAELFPRLSFNGNFSLESRTLLGLGGPGSESFLAGPRLTWAAFDLGRVKTRIKAANAEADVALADYQQTVLSALEDTENALVNFAGQRTRLIALKEASSASLEARRLTQLRFESGVGDFMSVLDAERRVLEDERQRIRGQTATLTALLTVYKALGGGWEAFEQG
ncbi:MAG: efflux transporter outer membrane subunit [Methylococcaceae bacterium]